MYLRSPLEDFESVVVLIMLDLGEGLWGCAGGFVRIQNLRQKENDSSGEKIREPNFGNTRL